MNWRKYQVLCTTTKKEALKGRRVKKIIAGARATRAMWTMVKGVRIYL